MTWDITTPVGTEAANNGDNRIRELKADLQTALRGNATDGDEAKFPGSDTANPIYRYRGLKGSAGSRPAAGQYGLYFNTTRNELQRDNGSTWEDIGTHVPVGTVQVFYQAAAPTGWTKVATQDDKVLRVVSGTGGGSGGSAGIAAGITHVVNAHTHTTPDTSHTHVLASAGTTGSVNYTGSYLSIGGPTATDELRALTAAGGETITRRTATTDSKGSAGVTGAASDSGTDTVTLAYIDVIICSKD